MRKAILEINSQFSFKPVIVNSGNLGHFDKFVVAGMGGSNLASDLLRIRDPFLDIIVHRNYGLPCLPKEELSSRLFIINSYSGNTQETIDVLERAQKEGFSCAVMSKGGRLIELAKSHSLPYCQLPDTGIQPRASLGFQLKAFLKIIGRDDLLTELSALAETFRAQDYEKEGEKLSRKLTGFVPIIYASAQNLGLAYNWKIKFNETGKIPAFYNVFPELNHNEMAGFDAKGESKELSRKFYFIFLKDEKDHPQIQKRMDITKKLYQDRDFRVEVLEMAGEPSFGKIFASLVLADWTAFWTAQIYGLQAEQVPMVQELKSLLESTNTIYGNS